MGERVEFVQGFLDRAGALRGGLGDVVPDDQFALGLLIYELVTRTRPFERPTTPVGASADRRKSNAGLGCGQAMLEAQAAPGGPEP